jgi:hypothetical protein
MNEEDSISIDSVYSYFEDLKSSLKSELIREELQVDNDINLITSEKLILIAANFNLRESLDQVIDGLVSDMINNENARVSGFLKKLKNWFKRIVNVVATVIARMVPAAVIGAVFGFTLLGPAGLAWGAGVGAILGVIEGLDCYSSNTCVTCVFCQPDQSKPCATTQGC